MGRTIGLVSPLILLGLSIGCGGRNLGAAFIGDASSPDVAVIFDATPPDGGAVDAARPDAGRTDAASPDGGPPDAAVLDGAVQDAAPPNCGDGVLDPSIEVCDGTDVAGVTCESLGFWGGSVSCGWNCQFIDESSCFRCGDGVLNGPEECDGIDLGGVNCNDMGFGTGTPSCDASCALDFSTCCGDGTIGDGEQCEDGNDVDWDGCTDCAISEFQVNEFTVGSQDSPMGAIDSQGRLIVVWEDHSAGTDIDVFLRRYASSGEPLGAPFRLNTTVLNNQTRPRVVALPSDDIVTIWSGYGPTGYGVIMQRLDSSGALVGGETVLSEGTSYGTWASLAADALGNVVVVWSAEGSGQADDVYFRRLDASGVALGPPTLANSILYAGQLGPELSVNAAGEFVIVWQTPTGGNTVVARLFQPDGTPVTGEINVNSAYPSPFYPRVALSDTGRFVVTWRDHAFCDCYRVFAADGAALTGEVVIDGCPIGTRYIDEVPVVAEPGGSFLIGWGGTTAGVTNAYLGRMGVNSQVLGPGTRLTVAVTSQPKVTGIAMAADGRYAVIWSESSGLDGDAWGVFAQRFSAQDEPLGLLPW